MSDILSYALLLGVFVLPAFVIAKIAERIMQWVFEGQMLLLSLPIP